MMGGTSPYQFNSPSFHSSSYLPKMEANFWNNLKCCNETFNDLHALLSHFEEIHSQAPSNFPYRMSGTPRRKSSTLDAVFTKNTHGRGGLSSAPMMQDLSNDSLLDTKDTLPDLETFGGDMEMDAADQTMFQTDLSNYGQQSGLFSNMDNSMMPSALDMTNLGDDGSNPTTPHPPQTGFSQNPMLSSVNTPSFAGSAHQSTQNTPRLAHAGLAIGADPTIGLGPTQYSATTNTMPFTSQMLQRLNNDFSTFDLGNNNDMLDLCIAEPAKALYAENGGFNLKAFPQFNFTQNIPINNSDENARKLQAHRLASGVGKVPNEEERPFKCPVIGCEKAYKNANGLRYHEKVCLILASCS
jgi:transcription factor SFP1